MKKFLIAVAITGAFAADEMLEEEVAFHFIAGCSHSFMNEAELEKTCFENGKFPNGKMPASFQKVRDKIKKSCKNTKKAGIECISGGTYVPFPTEIEGRPGVYGLGCSAYCDIEDPKTYINGNDNRINWVVKKVNGKFVVDTDSLE